MFLWTFQFGLPEKLERYGSVKILVKFLFLTHDFLRQSFELSLISVYKVNITIKCLKEF